MLIKCILLGAITGLIVASDLDDLFAIIEDQQQTPEQPTTTTTTSTTTTTTSIGEEEAQRATWREGTSMKTTMQHRIRETSIFLILQKLI
jgi:hypothetical protein